eukprot:Em0002g1251a
MCIFVCLPPLHSLKLFNLWSKPIQSNVQVGDAVTGFKTAENTSVLRRVWRGGDHTMPCQPTSPTCTTGN